VDLARGPDPLQVIDINTGVELNQTLPDEIVLPLNLPLSEVGHAHVDLIPDGHREPVIHVLENTSGTHPHQSCITPADNEEEHRKHAGKSGSGLASVQRQPTH
jgi:hypothetical protein